MGLISEFKEFAVKGNVVDLAIGVIIGTAFGKIVSSLVGDVFMPLLGTAMSGVDFATFAITLKPAIDKAPAVLLSYGKLIQTMIDFFIIAMCLFFVVKAMNTFKKKNEVPEPPAEPSNEEKLLTEIRDLLKEKK
jgi:large conductance mechanosensitive channel